MKVSLRGVSNKLGQNEGSTGHIYVHMFTEPAASAVKQLYGNRAVLQDDSAKIHRVAEALKACEAFPACIPPDCQAPTMADVWPRVNM